MSRQAMFPIRNGQCQIPDKKMQNKKTPQRFLTNIHFDNADMCTLTTATTITIITTTTNQLTNYLTDPVYV